ncbi:MAG: hypothetical protein Q7T74_07200 [Candidatus Saccharibacteria bacterium]|nr:hypothetical protein [Candidatus Saccharibacteria bacterium]
MQNGFDFTDDIQGYAAQPKGTWLAKEHTTQEYLAAFSRAQRLLLSMAGIGRLLFSRGLGAASAEHQHQLAHCEHSETERYRLWHSKFACTGEEYSRFVSHCIKFQDTQFEGISYKVRQFLQGVKVGIYVEGVGSLVTYCLHEKKEGRDGHITYTPERDDFFLNSYLDAAPMIYAPCSLWEKAYCAQAIAESKDIHPSVKTFVLDGREFVNKGGMSTQNWRDCNAYSLCPLSAWKGETFTYRSLISAFDDGSLQRGDSRGLIVKVRGVLCVLESFYRIFDNDVSSGHTAIYDDDEDDENEDESEQEQCLELA